MSKILSLFAHDAASGDNQRSFSGHDEEQKLLALERQRESEARLKLLEMEMRIYGRRSRGE
jgi:hypothetical protein